LYWIWFVNEKNKAHRLNEMKFMNWQLDNFPKGFLTLMRITTTTTIKLNILLSYFFNQNILQY
jgi:hypothetical protein